MDGWFAAFKPKLRGQGVKGLRKEQRDAVNVSQTNSEATSSVD